MKKVIPRMSIDPSRVSPVPKEDIDRFKKAMQERVIKPMEERRRERYRRAAAIRRWLAGGTSPFPTGDKYAR